jgi:AcrR family transcriptional regulator
MNGRRLKAEDRRRQIIQNAARVFAEKGLEGARTRDIAKACGINEAVLYRHFPSKQNLFHEVNAFMHRNAINSWRIITQSAPNGLAALRAVIRAQCRECVSGPEGPAVMVHTAAVAMHDKNMRDVYAGWHLATHAFLSSIVARGIADGSIRKDLDPGRIALIVLGLTWQACILRIYNLYDGRLIHDPEELFETVMSYVESGAMPAKVGDRPQVFPDAEKKASAG